MIGVHAFDGLTGRWLAHVPASACSWSQTINGEGGMDATVPAGAGLPVHALQPWRAIWAAVDGATVLHAGWLTRVKTAVDGSVQATIGDGWTIWAKRLVLNHNLDAAWHDGQILIDEDNPPGDWILNLKGTWSDIARGLVAESLKWGSLPYDLPAIQGGSSHERNYQCWDMSTISDRLGDLTDLDDGPEIRFDPHLTDDGRIRWLLRVGTPEIVDHTWRWNPAAPGQRVTLGDMDRDGTDMTGQCWAVGGKQDDVVLMCRRTGGTLTAQGWPLLQTANTSHSSVSILRTLQSYAAADVSCGDATQDVTGLTVPASNTVRPGDHAHVIRDRTLLDLKITDVDGDIATGRLDLQARTISEESL